MPMLPFTPAELGGLCTASFTLPWPTFCFTPRVRAAKSSEARLSGKLVASGLTWQIMRDLAEPPRQSCSRQRRRDRKGGMEEWKVCVYVYVRACVGVLESSAACATEKCRRCLLFWTDTRDTASVHPKGATLQTGTNVSLP